MSNELALTFECGGETLVAVTHVPELGGKTGILVLVGGPQYRAGSHRQFVLLGRHLAGHGIPVFRFDHRGVGDSSGKSRSFLSISDDIKSAIDAFLAINSEVQQVYIWGICDAASAAVLYAHKDPRVAGLILLNPWVRTEAGLARAYLSNYYVKLALSAQFWKELATGRRKIHTSLLSLLASIRAAMNPEPRSVDKSTIVAKEEGAALPGAEVSFPERMLASLRKFSGRTLFVLSGEDITAAEFRNLVHSDRRWKRTISRSSVDWVEIPNSDHTFSSRVWRDHVASITMNWTLRR